MSPRSATLALVAAASAFTGCAEPDDGIGAFERALDSIFATVSASDGDLSVKHAGQGVWEPGGIASPLYGGDWLRTGRGAWAHVELVGGGALDIEEEAVVVLEPLARVERSRPDTPESAPLVTIESGSVRATLSDRGGQERPLWVRTAGGEPVRVDRRPEAGAADVRIASVNGQPEVSVAQGEVKISRGTEQQLIAPGGGAALAAEALTPLTMPSRPVLRTPTAEARLQAGTVVLGWQASEGAASWRVQVAKDSSFRTVELSALVAEPQLELDAQPGVHHWRAAARDASGRQSPWSLPRRLFAEREKPSEALLSPAPGAAFGFTDGPPRVGLKWAARASTRAYRVVVAKDPELTNPVVSEITSDNELRVDTLPPGEYYWGVFAMGAGPEPVFLAPRKLVVKKVSGNSVVAPKRIGEWGK